MFLGLTRPVMLLSVNQHFFLTLNSHHPPESPTFDLVELENTDLDMNRLFFILLWLIDPLVWFFSDNYSLLQL